MLLVKVNQENTISQYPYTVADLRRDNPNVSFPEDEVAINIADLTPYGAHRVTLVPQPAFNWMTHAVTENTPTLVDGKWTQRWDMTELSLEHQARQRLSLQNLIVDATQRRLDAFATTRGYDNVNSIAKYKDISDEEIATLPAPQQALVTKFRTESRYLALATANTWAKLFVILAEVEAGTRPVPAGFADVEPDLPELVWPV